MKHIQRILSGMLVIALCGGLIMFFAVWFVPWWNETIGLTIGEIGYIIAFLGGSYILGWISLLDPNKAKK